MSQAILRLCGPVLVAMLVPVKVVWGIHIFKQKYLSAKTNHSELSFAELLVLIQPLHYLHSRVSSKGHGGLGL